MRTTKTNVTFAHPFRIAPDGETYPAGAYDVETDEEAIEGNDRTAYVRVKTLLFVKVGGTTSIHTVDPTALAEALARDAQQSLERR